MKLSQHEQALADDILRLFPQDGSGSFIIEQLIQKHCFFLLRDAALDKENAMAKSLVTKAGREKLEATFGRKLDDQDIDKILSEIRNEAAHFEVPEERGEPVTMPMPSLGAMLSDDDNAKIFSRAVSQYSRDHLATLLGDDAGIKMVLHEQVSDIVHSLPVEDSHAWRTLLLWAMIVGLTFISYYAWVATTRRLDDLQKRLDQPHAQNSGPHTEYRFRGGVIGGPMQNLKAECPVPETDSAGAERACKVSVDNDPCAGIPECTVTNGGITSSAHGGGGPYSPPIEAGTGYSKYGGIAIPNSDKLPQDSGPYTKITPATPQYLSLQSSVACWMQVKRYWWDHPATKQSEKVIYEGTLNPLHQRTIGAEAGDILTLRSGCPGHILYWRGTGPGDMHLDRPPNILNSEKVELVSFRF